MNRCELTRGQVPHAGVDGVGAHGAVEVGAGGLVDLGQVLHPGTPGGLAVDADQVALEVDEVSSNVGDRGATHQAHLGAALVAIVRRNCVHDIRKHPYVLGEVCLVSTIVIREFGKAHLLLANKKNMGNPLRIVRMEHKI